ncbi:MAG: ABC transporter substrate-binding protein [Mesorhizobium sp.]|uniref:ABC transporter substrate-binding protein n=1 Tax=Mesorhizobium sp. TaxID=1871066 RepID=UPI000FE92FE8|nr:ABC transporter substrate-binding protein [Mesorhizobium sp.]RWI57092.1 MAG: ABC transporter substrate-binding protein [Mesorhizobium sp.]
MKLATKLSPLLLTSFLASAASVAAQSPEFTARTAAGGPIKSVTWTLLAEPASLDPAQSNEVNINTVLANLCDQLFVIDADFKVQNWLAKSVEQPDSRTYVYKLRTDARFWDDTPVTAEDVAFSLSRNLDPSVKSRWARYYVNVDKIEVVDPETVKVSLKQPDVLFGSAMATAASAVLKKSHVEANNNVIGTKQVRPMCSGPFKLTAWNSGVSMVMEKNQTYWNTGHAAKAERFEFRFIPDAAAQVNSLLTGQTQGTYNPTGTVIAALRRAASGQFYFGRSFLTYQLVPNKRADDTPLLANEDARQALSLAVDRKAIAERIFAGTVVPSVSPVPSAAFGGATDVPVPPIDLDKAKALMAKAGALPRPLVLAYPARADQELMATIIMDAGRKIGLPIELKAVPIDQFIASLFDPKLRQYDMVMMNKNINMPDPLDFYAVFAQPPSGPKFAPLNFNHYENDLIDKARSTIDDGERLRLVRSINDRFIGEKAWIPLIEFANTLYMDKSITGATASYNFSSYPWATDVGAAGK